MVSSHASLDAIFTFQSSLALYLYISPIVKTDAGTRTSILVIIGVILLTWIKNLLWYEIPCLDLKVIF